MILFTCERWPAWFDTMQSPEWDRTTALIFADWCDEEDAPAVAAYVRVAVELDGLDCSEPFCERYADQMGCGCGECRRYRKNRPVKMRRDDILHANRSAWSSLPCPECGGSGKIIVGDLEHTTGWETTCQKCLARPLTRWPYTPFLRGVGLRMEEIAREVECERCGGDGQIPKERGKGGWTTQGTMYRCPDCSGIGTPCRPTPLALALVAGLPTLRQLRVTDREPYRSQFGYCWYDSRGNAAEFAAHHLPPPIWDCMSLPVLKLTESHYQHLKVAPTPDAAHDALASGAWEWVAGFVRRNNE